MTHPIAALVAVDEGADADDVRSLLAATEDVGVAGVSGLEPSWSALGERGTDALIVVCAPGSDSALRFIREVARTHPDRPVVVLLTAPSANGFVRDALEAGAEDLVMRLPGDEANLRLPAGQLRFALEKAVARRSGATAATTGALAPLICVLGPKGGIGKTLTSANLAVGLALEGQRPTIVDLDLQFGDIGLSLGLTPKRTIYDLVKSGGAVDVEKVEGYLTEHASGVRVLMAPVRPDQATAVTIDYLRELYPLLRASSDAVIVDTPPGFSPEVIASIDNSTHVCMVGMLDSLSLKNTKLGLETLELMGYDRSRIRVVLNRADTHVGVTREDVAAIIGRAPDVLVPSHRDVVRSVNEGVPIVQSRPRTEAARAFRSLATLYSGVEQREKSRRRLRRAA
jgi:pilus assembly protein CpaE